jgi:deoxyribonuclease-1
VKAPVTTAPTISTSPSTSSSGEIIANKKSHIYHKPGCPDYDKVSEQNRVIFHSTEEAEKAGYRVAKNCTGK